MIKPFRFISLYASIQNWGNLQYSKNYIAIEIIHKEAKSNKHFFTIAINAFTSMCKSYYVCYFKRY